MEELGKDFRKALEIARDTTEQKIENRMDAQNQATRLARESLAFVLERGLADTGAATRALLGTASNPQNLPDAQQWARTRLINNFHREQMEV